MRSVSSTLALITAASVDPTSARLHGVTKLSDYDTVHDSIYKLEEESHPKGEPLPSIVHDTGPAEKRIYVIRHGDKTYDYNNPGSQTFACLSQMGWARAYNLVSLFGKSGVFPSPDAIFSAQYDSDILERLSESFPNISQERAEAIKGALANHGIAGNCRDENGWYRTQQTVSPVAHSLGLDVNNQTSFLPRVCLGEDPGPGECIPYSSNIRSNTPRGMCCNTWSAKQMVDELEKRSVNTILVAWEHKNIQFLSRALADFPPGNDEAVKEVERQVTYETEDGNVEDRWADDNYDLIYEFRYICDDDGACTFQSLTELSQNFTWLGPKFGSGFSVPDNWSKSDSNATYIEEDWVPDECIEGSSCPICPVNEQREH